MLDKGEGPKVLIAARKGWSRLLTFPRGDRASSAVKKHLTRRRHKARKG